MPEYTNQGDALRADKVIARARSIDKPRLIVLSGEHRGREVILRDSVYCVIDRPLRALQLKG